MFECVGSSVTVELSFLRQHVVELKLSAEDPRRLRQSVVTEDGITYLFTSADDNNVDDDMMMMMMMCPHVSS